MFLLYPFYAIGSLSITLIAYLISPILALLPDEDGNLPKWLYYFQTFDAPVPKGYWNGLKWLCRNPVYGFDLNLFGIEYDPKKWKTIYNKNGLLVFVCTNGAFSIANDKENPLNDKWYLPSLKLGWKVFNFTDENRNPVSYGMSGLNKGKVPFCFSIF